MQPLLSHSEVARYFLVDPWSGEDFEIIKVIASAIATAPKMKRPTLVRLCSCVTDANASLNRMIERTPPHVILRADFCACSLGDRYDCFILPLGKS